MDTINNEHKSGSVGPGASSGSLRRHVDFASIFAHARKRTINVSKSFVGCLLVRSWPGNWWVPCGFIRLFEIDQEATLCPTDTLIFDLCAPRGRFEPPLGFPERPQIEDKSIRRHSCRGRANESKCSSAQMTTIRRRQTNARGTAHLNFWVERREHTTDYQTTCLCTCVI